MDCLFCKIATGEIPSQKVYEDEKFYAFRDINPVAKKHLLIIPKKHISTLNEIDAENITDLSNILLIGKKVAQMEGLAESGYRFVFNCNDDSGMEIKHIHLHVIGGEKLGQIG